MQGFNFTEDVRKVLAIAREESSRLHHEYVGPEHILLAFTAPDTAAPAQLLRRAGAEPGEVRATIEQTIRRGNPATRIPPDLPYTSRAKKTLEWAMLEARELQHGFVGSEHLLLGLIREEKGIAAMVLAHHGVRAEAIRAALLEHHPPEQVIDLEWESRPAPGEHTTYYHVRIGRRVIWGLAALWAALWVYLQRDILDWRQLALFLVIVVPPMLLLYFTRRDRRW